jgi:membrane protease YdiL (CAAX protease family)
MLEHYFLAYMSKGFIGFGTSYTETEKTAVFIEGMPLSLFTNTSLELYIFLALISMIATIAFYRSGNQQRFLQEQAVKRYFRFVLPVSAAILLTYGLNIVCFHKTPTT